MTRIDRGYIHGRTRKFNGVYYSLYDTIYYVNESDRNKMLELVKKLKKEGKKVRVTSSGDGYIYAITYKIWVI